MAATSRRIRPNGSRAKNASRLAPHDPSYHYQCSVLARDLGRHGEAMAEAEAAAQIMPTHSVLLLLLGQLHLDCGRRMASDDPLSPAEHMAQAEALLERIQALAPDGPEATTLREDLEQFRAALADGTDSGDGAGV